MDNNWLAILSGNIEQTGAPVLPPERVQVTTTGRYGLPVMADALRFKEFLRALLVAEGHPLSRNTRVLDFGCGWGRILRTFLNEIDEKNLTGVDPQQWLIDIATESTKRQLYHKIDQLPPSNLPRAGYDLIYAYSVFSHLSETTALGWIEEFARLLTPGGIVVLTTRPRAHIQVWHEGNKTTVHSGAYARLFSNVRDDLAAYDRGQFVFHAEPGYELTAEHWGEAVIPAIYAETNWQSDKLSYVGYFENYSDAYLQPAIVMRRLC